MSVHIPATPSQSRRGSFDEKAPAGDGNAGANGSPGRERAPSNRVPPPIDGKYDVDAAQVGLHFRYAAATDISLAIARMKQEHELPPAAERLVRGWLRGVAQTQELDLRRATHDELRHLCREVFAFARDHCANLVRLPAWIRDVRPLAEALNDLSADVEVNPPEENFADVNAAEAAQPLDLRGLRLAVHLGGDALRLRELRVRLDEPAMWIEQSAIAGERRDPTEGFHELTVSGAAARKHERFTAWTSGIANNGGTLDLRRCMDERALAQFAEFLRSMSPRERDAIRRIVLPEWMWDVQVLATDTESFAEVLQHIAAPVTICVPPDAEKALDLRGLGPREVHLVLDPTRRTKLTIIKDANTRIPAIPRTVWKAGPEDRTQEAVFAGNNPPRAPEPRAIKDVLNRAQNGLLARAVRLKEREENLTVDTHLLEAMFVQTVSSALSSAPGAPVVLDLRKFPAGCLQKSGLVNTAVASIFRDAVREVTQRPIGGVVCASYTTKVAESIGTLLKDARSPFVSVRAGDLNAMALAPEIELRLRDCDMQHRPFTVATKLGTRIVLEGTLPADGPMTHLKEGVPHIAPSPVRRAAGAHPSPARASPPRLGSPSGQGRAWRAETPPWETHEIRARMLARNALEQRPQPGLKSSALNLGKDLENAYSAFKRWLARPDGLTQERLLDDFRKLVLPIVGLPSPDSKVESKAESKSASLSESLERRIASVLGKAPSEFDPDEATLLFWEAIAERYPVKDREVAARSHAMARLGSVLASYSTKPMERRKVAAMVWHLLQSPVSRARTAPARARDIVQASRDEAIFKDVNLRRRLDLLELRGGDAAPDGRRNAEAAEAIREFLIGLEKRWVPWGPRWGGPQTFGLYKSLYDKFFAAGKNPAIAASDVQAPLDRIATHGTFDADLARVALQKALVQLEPNDPRSPAQPSSPRDRKADRLQEEADELRQVSENAGSVEAICMFIFDLPASRQTFDIYKRLHDRYFTGDARLNISGATQALVDAVATPETFDPEMAIAALGEALRHVMGNDAMPQIEAEHIPLLKGHARAIEKATNPAVITSHRAQAATLLIGSANWARFDAGNKTRKFGKLREDALALLSPRTATSKAPTGSARRATPATERKQEATPVAWDVPEPMPVDLDGLDVKHSPEQIRPPSRGAEPAVRRRLSFPSLPATEFTNWIWGIDRSGGGLDLNDSPNENVLRERLLAFLKTPKFRELREAGKIKGVVLPRWCWHLQPVPPGAEKLGKPIGIERLRKLKGAGVSFDAKPGASPLKVGLTLASLLSEIGAPLLVTAPRQTRGVLDLRGLGSLPIEVTIESRGRPLRIYADDLEKLRVVHRGTPPPRQGKGALAALKAAISRAFASAPKQPMWRTDVGYVDVPGAARPGAPDTAYAINFYMPLLSELRALKRRDSKLRFDERLLGDIFMHTVLSAPSTDCSKRTVDLTRYEAHDAWIAKASGLSHKRVEAVFREHVAKAIGHSVDEHGVTRKEIALRYAHPIYEPALSAAEESSVYSSRFSSVPPTPSASRSRAESKGEPAGPRLDLDAMRHNLQVWLDIPEDSAPENVQGLFPLLARGMLAPERIDELVALDPDEFMAQKDRVTTLMQAAILAWRGDPGSPLIVLPPIREAQSPDYFALDEWDAAAQREPQGPVALNGQEHFAVRPSAKKSASGMADWDADVDRLAKAAQAAEPPDADPDLEPAGGDRSE